MKLAEQFCEILTRTYQGDAEGEAFHGPAFKHVIHGVDAKTAHVRLKPGGNTLAELVNHLKVWRRVMCASLAKEPAVNVDTHEAWWPKPADASEAAWQASLKELDQLQERFVRLFSQVDDAEYQKRFNAVTFLLHHDLYHTGQIGLLKSLAAK